MHWIAREALFSAMMLGLGLAPATAETWYDEDEYRPQNLQGSEEIAVNGQIKEVRSSSLILDYGKHTIEVDTDAITRDADDHFIPGTRVKVMGQIDDLPTGGQVIRASRIEKFIEEWD